MTLIAPQCNQREAFTDGFHGPGRQLSVTGGRRYRDCDVMENLADPMRIQVVGSIAPLARRPQYDLAPWPAIGSRYGLSAATILQSRLDPGEVAFELLV